MEPRIQLSPGNGSSDGAANNMLCGRHANYSERENVDAYAETGGGRGCSGDRRNTKNWPGGGGAENRSDVDTRPAQIAASATDLDED